MTVVSATIGVGLNATTPKVQPDTSSASGTLRMTLARQERVPGQKRHTLEVLVDGRTHPELIPTDYAYRHLLMATAPSQTASPKLRLFVEGRIKLIGLSKADATIYESTLRELRLRDELARIATTRASLDAQLARRFAPAIQAMHRLDAERRDLLARAKTEVLRNVSSEGVLLLEHHLETYVKPRIQILGGNVHHHADS
jgi:hypothetical protein